MSQFKSSRVTVTQGGGSIKIGASGLGGDSVAANSSLSQHAQVPSYTRSLPPFKAPYQHVIEMFNKKTCKRRIIACDSAAMADQYLVLLNLVNSFLTYEQLLSKEAENNNFAAEPSKEASTSALNQRRPQVAGPVFITNWVKTFIRHGGVMEFSEEYFEQQNFPYLLAFGRETDAVKAMVFAESFRFLGEADHVEARMLALTNILQTFNKDTITSILFRGNYMIDGILKQVLPNISQYTRLHTLEIINNALGNSSLETLGVIFSGCPTIQKINLQNNLLGQGQGQLQAIDLFLSQMLTELDNPVHLDLSVNKFTDESIYPFVKYIFANEECRLKYFSLEQNNLFSAYGKRTLLKGYSLSPNKAAIHFRLSPLPFTDSTLKHAFSHPASAGGESLNLIKRKVAQISGDSKAKV